MYCGHIHLFVLTVTGFFACFFPVVTGQLLWTSCLLLAVGTSLPMTLLQGLPRGCRSPRCHVPTRTPQGSQEPGGTLGPSVASEGFTRGLGEIMKVSPLDQTQPLT